LRRSLQTLGTVGLSLFTLFLTIANPHAAHAQVTSYAFVPNLSSDFVTVIDTASNTVVGSVSVPGGSRSVAITPDGRRAYLVGAWAEVVQPIDVATRMAIGSPIFTGGQPLGIAIAPDGLKAYVARQSPASVSVINLATHIVGPTMTHPDMLLARGLAFTPDGQKAYVTAGTGLFPIDPSTQTIGARISLHQLSGIAITPDGQTAYAAAHAVGGVVIADAALGTIVPPTLVIGGSPGQVAFSAGGQFAYVADNSSSIKVIEVATRTVTTNVPLSGIARAMAFTADGRYAYVTLDNTVVVVDAATHTVVGTPIPTGSTPLGYNGGFITPPLIVAAGGPLNIANDADLDALHFGPTFARFHGGTLRLTAPWTTTRHLSLLGSGGTIDTDGFDATVSGNAINDGTLTKIGAGTLTLSGTSTNTGGTVVSAGTLVVNGTHTAVPISVAGGALGGSGSLGTVTATAGAISPGPAAGTAILHAADVTFAAGALFIVDLQGITAGTGYDRLEVSGTAAVDGATLMLMPSFAPATGTTFTILTNATGAFAGLPEGASIAAAARHFRISYVGGDGNDVTLTVLNEVPTISSIAPQTVPENTPLAPIAFTVGDTDGDPATLTITATSSNQTLVPDANLAIGGSGAARTIAAMPRTAERGVTTITLTVGDGTDAVTTSFTLTVSEGTYYLAEGATGSFFDTDILLANPNSVAASIVVRFLKEDGTSIEQTRTLPAMSRTTIHADDIAGLENAAFATIVASTDALPIVVERTMRWDATGYGAHTEKATAGAAQTWYFGEGSQGFFSTFFLLVNSHAVANTAHVTYFRENAAAVTRDYSLAPGSRTTIDAGADVALRDRSFGARVTFDLPGVAERAMYFGTDPLWRGGHGSAGTTEPSTSWFLAEGATGTYFTTFVLMANPNADAAEVTVTYLPDSGVPVTKSYTIPGGERLTRNIAVEDAALVNAAVATRVESTRPIVVERSQYWGQPDWIEGHNSPGVTAAAPRWGLAEGRVGGADATQTYILLANAGTTSATVTVTFLRANGTTLIKTFTVAPTSRFNVAIVPGAGSMVTELADESFGALIDATQPIVVERSLYSNANGLTWAAGTNAPATRLP
jgi:autotransporter-associated beta strand protein/YVTN family beta-propeller protein